MKMKIKPSIRSRAGTLLAASLLYFSVNVSHSFDFDPTFPNFDIHTIILVPVFTHDYPLLSPVTINPTRLSLVLPPLDLGGYEVTTGYDPIESHVGENAQLGFLLLDGTLAFTVQAVDEQSGRTAARARARVRVAFDPASIRARARASGRAGARAGDIANARLMRYDEEGAQWVRAVRSIRSAEGRANIEFMPRLPLSARSELGHYGNFHDVATNSAYVWAVLDTNSKYAVGVNQLLDTDEDAVLDEDDNCPLTTNADQQDSDTDNIGDACDADRDGDDTDNEVDNCPDVSNFGQEDTDGDLDGDACDIDDDDDTILDTADNCPLIANLNQLNMDIDGKGDACDADLDGDGVDNEIDNCPILANGGQSDFDYDSTGDACDSDIDGDSVANTVDICEFSATGAVVNPNDGCSVTQSCPCEGPRGSTETWRNHGKYMSCTAKASGALLKMGLIMDFEKDEIVSVAAESACGMK